MIIQLVLALLATIALTAPPELTVVTWNVLGEPVDAQSRAAAISRVLEASDADVIALQEVWPGLLRHLWAQPWVAQGGYQGVGTPKGQIAPLGLYVLSRHPIEAIRLEPLPTVHGRGVLIATLGVAERTVTLAVVHLDSFLYLGPTRGRQLVRIGRLIGDGHAILAGDLNFGDGEPEELLIPSGLEDAWRTLHPTTPGVTWDTRRNPLAQAHALPGEGSRRLDRILSRGPWKATEATLVGDRPFDRDRFPSDHFGVRAVLRPHP